MKRKAFYLNILVLVLFSACKEKNKSENVVPEIETESNVVFKIDERTEFLRIIFNLALHDDLDEDMQPCKTEYVERVNTHFIDFKDHPLLTFIRNDENIGIDFSTVGLMYKNLETFEFDTVYTKELEYLGLTEKTLDSMRPLLKDFYQKSEFNEFFKSNETYYKRAIAKIEKQVIGEKLFDKMIHFYQVEQKGLELIVFVELTNNANNRAVDFYDKYNPEKGALILANFCEMPDEATDLNEVLELDNSIRGVLYHEISHLFTTKLLDKYIGNLEQYKSICEDCSAIEIRDKVDHMIVRPLQAILMERFDNNSQGTDFYLNKSKDASKDIYQRLSEFRPENEIPFENVYIECIKLIQESSP